LGYIRKSADNDVMSIVVCGDLSRRKLSENNSKDGIDTPVYYDNIVYKQDVV